MRAFIGYFTRHPLKQSESASTTTTEPEAFACSDGTSLSPHSPEHVLPAKSKPSTSTQASLQDRISRNSGAPNTRRNLTNCDILEEKMVGNKALTGSRPFKPVNTLAATLNGSRTPWTSSHTTPSTLPSTLEVRSSEGSNVAISYGRSNFARYGVKRRRISSPGDSSDRDIGHGTVDAKNARPLSGRRSTGMRDYLDNGDQDPLQNVSMHTARPKLKKPRKSRDHQSFSSVTDNQSVQDQDRPLTSEFSHYSRRTAHERSKKTSRIADHDPAESDSEDVLHGGSTQEPGLANRSESLRTSWSLREFHTHKLSLQISSAPELSFDESTRCFALTRSNQGHTPAKSTSLDATQFRIIYHHSESRRIVCRGVLSHHIDSNRYLLMEFCTPKDAGQFTVTAARYIEEVEPVSVAPPSLDEQYNNARREIENARMARASTTASPRRQLSKVVTRPLPEPPVTRRSSRIPDVSFRCSPSPVPEKWTELHTEKIRRHFSHTVVYPAVGENRVSVEPQDLERLDDGEFLNDNVINFALRQIYENMAPAKRPQIHMFNTHFYTAMTANAGRNRVNYGAVKRWTRKKDIFKVPFVIVPINLNLHWYAAVICNLNMLVGPDLVEGSQLDDHSILISPDRTPSEDVIMYEDSPAVEQPKMVPPKKRKTAPLRKFSPSEPVIITLDSFGTLHPAEIRNLKEYVVAEALDKRSLKIETQDMKGLTAKGLPEQSNFCDCGLYLIAYIQRLAQDPKGFIKRILERDETGMARDFAGFDASAERKRLRDDLFKISEQQLAERAARKKSKKQIIPVVGPLDLDATPQPAVSTSNPLSDQPSSPSKAEKPESQMDVPASSHDGPLGDTVPDSQEEDN